MRIIYVLLILIPMSSCQGQEVEKSDVNTFIEENQKQVNKGEIEEYYEVNTKNNLLSSSIGTVSSGSLKNGRLMPFAGNNFHYFDTLSYLSDRAFVNDKVEKAVVETYKKLEESLPDRKFVIMECSLKSGGKLFPHRTHQNGLSIDFMMPLIKDNKPYYGLDNLGVNHYFLEFDDGGKYKEDSSISIDFDLVARHLILLEKKAREHGLKISKVIIKTELKPELYSFSYGQLLMNSGIYVVRNLSPLINSLHDDHYHVDFELIEN